MIFLIILFLLTFNYLFFIGDCKIHNINNNFNIKSKLTFKKKITNNINMLNEKEIKDIDNEIINLGKPLIVDNISYPILGILESIIISKMIGLNSLATLTIGDQLFGLFLNFFSFIPSILLPIISKFNIRKRDKRFLINVSFISLFLTQIISIIVTTLIFLNSKSIISSGILISISKTNNIKDSLDSYFKLKILSFPICMITIVIQVILKGMSSYSYVVKSNLISYACYIILNPIFIRYFDLDGVNILNFIIELSRCIILTSYFIKKIGITDILIYFRNISLDPITFFKESWSRFIFFVSNGFFIQTKNIVRKITYMKINSKLLSLDNNGEIIGYHIILCKIYDLFQILFKCLNSVSSILIPRKLADPEYKAFNSTINRIYDWFSKITKYQLIICFGLLLTIYFSNIYNLIPNFILVHFKSIFESKELNSILTSIIFVNLTGVFNSLISFMEIILQSKGEYKLHSILSIVFSLLTIPLIKYYTKLEIVWVSCLTIALVKFIFMKLLVLNQQKITD